MELDSTSGIHSKQQLATFVDTVLRDFVANGASWENQDLARFLDAFQAWLQDSDGYYANHQIPMSEQNPWRVVADALAAARIYE
jgi:hypothetical protein